MSIRFSESTVADLASAAMLSSGSLWERFRREIGVPPVEFLARVRVEVIKQRLCEPGCPSLERLAEEVGFCHASHLCRTFVRYVDIPPGRYRRNMQADR